MVWSIFGSRDTKCNLSFCAHPLFNLKFILLSNLSYQTESLTICIWLRAVQKELRPYLSQSQNVAPHFGYGGVAKIALTQFVVPFKNKAKNCTALHLSLPLSLSLSLSLHKICVHVLKKKCACLFFYMLCVTCLHVRFVFFFAKICYICFNILYLLTSYICIVYGLHLY